MKQFFQEILGSEQRRVYLCFSGTGVGSVKWVSFEFQGEFYNEVIESLKTPRYPFGAFSIKSNADSPNDIHLLIKDDFDWSNFRVSQGESGGEIRYYLVGPAGLCMPIQRDLYLFLSDLIAIWQT